MDPWSYALALLTGTLAVHAVRWPADRVRRIRLLDPVDDDPPRRPKAARRPAPPARVTIAPRISSSDVAAVRPTPKCKVKVTAPKRSRPARPTREAVAPASRPRAVAALAVLGEVGPITMADLAPRLGVGSCATRNLLHALVSAGLARRAVAGWVAVQPAGSDLPA